MLMQFDAFAKNHNLLIELVAGLLPTGQGSGKPVADPHCPPVRGL